MATYKTPDVYVKEVSVFPPSVAEVETAIPVFIGYTEKAMKVSKGDLHNKAQKVTSLVDFETFFGKGAPIDEIDVTIDAELNVDKVELENTFYLYDSLRLFYQNGGGKCYIISVGTYNVEGLNKSAGHFEDGLAILEKLDEPTMILFPDATTLENNALYNLQTQALAQCGFLMDRVAILDLKNREDHDDAVQEFRDNIGINNLKYGAAYTPWVRASFQRNIRYGNINFLDTGGGNINLASLTNDKELQEIVASLENVNLISDEVEATVIGTSFTAFNNLVRDFNLGIAAADSDDDHFDLVTPMFFAVQQLAERLIDFKTGKTDGEKLKLNTDLENIFSNRKLENRYITLMQHGRSLLDAAAAAYITAKLSGEWDLDPLAANAEIDTMYTDAANTKERTRIASRALISAFETFKAAVNDILTTAESYSRTFESTLRNSFPLYKQIIQEINNHLTVIPPSGAIAGVYAFVDRTRGVFKAPANVSLNSVSGLAHDIGFREQESLNVDVNAGKSINALRFFSGKGILVWGARTLAGNDNEWRYVPVRRFFNMAEESIKKSTYWAVFEPNDANLWVRVKAMIENYLILKWKEGALAGATPDDAFFVKVGLGVTMTPQDILEGRLNVEIGMAVVRPAEFIILSFSHKMQES